MATKRTISKTSKKSTVNFNWNNTNKSNKNSKEQTEKQLKKLNFTAVSIAFVFLVIGALGGFLTIKIVTKNDCFELVGKDEITLRLGENYEDLGAKIITFGSDDSSKVKIETNLTKNEDGTYTASEEGTYYITYTVDNFKYGKLFKVQKIRLISFVEATEQEEIENANQGGNE